MTFTLPNAYHSVWVVFQVACLLSPVSCLYGNIYLSVSVYIVNVILYFKYKFGLLLLPCPHGKSQLEISFDFLEPKTVNEFNFFALHHD